MKRLDDAAAVGPGKWTDPSFSDAVIAWQRSHGRHALPWQQTRDPYRIWLSEIMLQQTQVAAVIPYYLRFLERFPDVASLAAAGSEEVMALWSGLGYYSRARNLHRCAQQVVALHGGVFPNDPALLVELPGIGRSTAAAIAAFAYGARAAILDGNVKRVFCRVFGVEGFPGIKAVENELWLRAVALTPEPGVESYTQGLMDLGATLCTRSRPACTRCPLAPRCVALASNRVHLLPTPKPKKAIPQRRAIMLVIEDGDRVLLEQRPDSGIWGGLLSLPEANLPAPDELQAAPPAGAQTSAQTGIQLEPILAGLVARFGELASSQPLLPFSHTFTHFKLHVTPYRLTLARAAEFAGQSTHVWVDIRRLAGAPLPAPVKKLLLELYREPDLLAV